MKKLILGCAVLAAFTLSSCSSEKDKKEKVKKDFIASCLQGAGKNVMDEQSKTFVKDYCECAAEKITDKFTVKEIDEMNKQQKTVDPVKMQEMQQKLMPVLMPCLTEMQQKMMKTAPPAGGMPSAPAATPPAQ